MIVNGTEYPLGTRVPLPVGNNTIQYKITDAKANVAMDDTYMNIVLDPSGYGLFRSRSFQPGDSHSRSCSIQCLSLF